MDKQVMVCFLLVGLTVSCFSAVQLGSAAYRTITVPDDYPTITQAIQNASNGDTIVVKPGNYSEHYLQINNSIRLIGASAQNTIITNIDPEYLGSWPNLLSPMTIQIEADNVEVSGFSLNRGILVTGSGNQITNNAISISYISLRGSFNRFSDNAIAYTGGENSVEVVGSNNTLANNRLIHTKALCGISLKGEYNIAYANTIMGDGWPGIGTKYNSSNNLIARNILTNCSIDFETASSNNTVCGNRITLGGISLMGFNNVFYANEFPNLFIGGTHGGTADWANNVFYHNNFMAPAPEVKIWTANPGPSSWSKDQGGNFWQSYNGTDANNDGVGDAPYTVEAAYYDYDNSKNMLVNCGQDNYPLMAPFNINSVSITLPQWTYVPPMPTSTLQPTAGDTPTSPPTTTPASSPSATQNTPSPTPIQTTPPTPTVTPSSAQPTPTSSTEPPTNRDQPNGANFLPPAIVAAAIAVVIGAVMLLRRKRLRD